MPEICRFFCIIIAMYFDEHNPLRFHVQYNEYRASMDMRTLNFIRVRGLVEKWAELHRDELLRMWETADFHRIQTLV